MARLKTRDHRIGQAASEWRKDARHTASANANEAGAIHSAARRLSLPAVQDQSFEFRGCLEAFTRFQTAFGHLAKDQADAPRCLPKQGLT